jgi:hypothetical protein
MRHEVDPIMAVQIGQRRIPNAIEKHISQYSSFGHDQDHEGRANTIRSIVEILGIKEGDVPFHNPDEVNVTLMLIWSGRKDLAKALWETPVLFMSKHEHIFSMGKERVRIDLDNDQRTKKGRSAIRRWQKALQEVD